MWMRRHAEQFSALVALLVLAQGEPAFGFSSFITSAPTTNCSGCHGNPLVGSTPANGGTLDFGNVLVGESATRSWQIRNVSTNQRGGFKGSFPGASGEFGPATADPIDGVNGYLRAPAATPSAESRNYTYTPTSRGLDTLSRSFTPDSAYFSAAGGLTAAQAAAAQRQTITFRGRGVAPLVSVDASLANAGNVRLGTSGIAQVSVQNAGDGNLSGRGEISNLLGSFSASVGPFAAVGSAINLPDSASQSKQYAFTPTGRGSQSASININTANGSANGLNQAQTIPVLLSGTGVGPRFESSIEPGSTIDFGTTAAASAALSVSNATPDPDLGALTTLTLLSASITGPDATLFSLDGFTPGSQLTRGASLDFEIDFVAPAGTLGPRAALLTLLTDEGKALGVAGNAFAFDLVATAVPEPGAWQMLGAGLVCIGLLLRNRSRLRARIPAAERDWRSRSV